MLILYPGIDHVRLGFIVLVLFSPFSLRASAGPPEEEAKTLAAVAVKGYRANLEAFEFYTCRYTLTAGEAASLEDAVAGRFKPKPPTRTAIASVVKDGTSFCYKIEQDAETTKDLARPPQSIPALGIPGVQFGTPVPFNTTEYLSNGKGEFTNDPIERSANIADNSQRNYHMLDTLLNMLGVEQEHGFAQILNPASGLVLTAAEVLPGPQPLIRVVCEKPSGRTTEYTVDPAKGYLPVKIVSTSKDDPDRPATIVVSDFITCSDNRWYPKVLTRFLREPDPGFAQFAWQHRVTEFDADRRPPAEELTLTLAAGTVVCRSDDSRQYFKTRQVERVTAADLDRIYELADTSRPPLADTAIRTPPVRWPWYVAAGVGGVGGRGRRTRRLDPPPEATCGVTVA